MKISITSKLILIIGLLSLVTISGMFLLSRVKFQADFIDYLNEQHMSRMRQVARLALPLYEAEGSWNNVRRQPRLWRDLLGNSNNLGQSDRVEAPPLPMPMITLVDDRLRFVAGDEKLIMRELLNRNADTSDRLLRVPLLSEGKVVGYLIAPVRTRVSELAEEQFSNRQFRSSYTIALFVMVVILAITALVVTRLVRPVLALKQGTQELIRGNYQARVPRRSSDELGDLADDFNRLAATLDKNRSDQRRWISDISHELRTPIAILRGEIETMQAGIKPMNTKELTSLEEEVQRLMRLVDDLYLLSLSDAGELHYHTERFNLSELVERVLDEYNSRLSQAGIRVIRHFAGNSYPVEADPQRLQQVFNNLLENSCRYAPNAELHVRLARSNKQVSVVFEDSGPGVSAQDLPHLFDRLFRAEHSRSRQFGGGGLGLSICKSIVEAQGGTIVAEHSTLGGLRLRLEFPEIEEAEV